VIPDNSLAGLPWEALVVDASETDEPQYLLDVDLPIEYAPSATILMNLAERAAAKGTSDRPPVLTIGDCRYPQPTAPKDETLLAQLTPRSRYGTVGGELTPLPFSRREMQWVAEVFGAKGIDVAWLKQELATEATVRHNVSDRRIAHFACHGLVDQAYGNLFGALALTPGGSPNDPADDGFLTLAEVYELNLKGCELAILSACDTNIGPQQRGESIWALSRGFLVAGSRRVVASNWLVDDESAASLVSYFCSILAKAEKEGGVVDYASALHAAKRWVRSQEKWARPYYWGTFVLIGPN
jgi:CHAT domain-containing protein